MAGQPIQLDYEPRPEFDTGLFLSWYFQTLGGLSIASMLATPIFFRSFYLDLSFILFFWAAAALKRHSPTARKWVLTLCALTILIEIAIVLKAALWGPSSIEISFGHRRIANPSWWHVLAVGIPVMAVVAVPFFVLLSSKAKRQFAAPSRDSQPKPEPLPAPLPATFHTRSTNEL